MIPAASAPLFLYSWEAIDARSGFPWVLVIPDDDTAHRASSPDDSYVEHAKISRRYPDRAQATSGYEAPLAKRYPYHGKL